MAISINAKVVRPKTIDIAIDRGGTFTDVWAKVPGQEDIVIKLLSVNPGAYHDAPAEGRQLYFTLTIPK